jgi:hypothetical protein
VAQLLVIIQIFISQCQAVHPLRQHLLDAMLDQSRIAAIQKAFTEPPQEIDSLIGLPQQECSAIGTDRSPVELCYHFPLALTGECQPAFGTLCHRKAVSSLA